MVSKGLKLAIAFILFSLVSLSFVFADSESTNFKILSDSINVGGQLSSSSNFQLQDTLGESGTGFIDSSSYQLHAGYQQHYPYSVTITASASSVGMSSMNVSTGGTSSGSVGLGVITNNPNGYSLYVQASTSPALTCSSGGCTVGSDRFQDYIPGGAAPSYDWIWATSTSFGYNVDSSHINSFFKDNGSSCNAGSNDTSDKCWWYFTTSPKLVAGNTVSNILGTTTTLNFRAEAVSSSAPAPGYYQAEIIVTAIVN